MRVKPSEGPKSRITFKTSDAKVRVQLARWWENEREDAAAMEMLASAAYLKEGQGKRFKDMALYAKLYGNQSLFGFTGTSPAKMDSAPSLAPDRPTFNLIQSATDTLVSRIAQSRPQPRFLTDNSDYKQRTLAKKLNNFTLGEFYHTKAYEKGTQVLRDACVEGTGVLHTYETIDKRVGIERVLITELLVDPNEAMYGEPRQIYRMKLVDRDQLSAMFPDHEGKIKDAAQATPESTPASSKTVSDLVVVVEGWRLPSGKDTDDGRHMIACSAGCLLDEPYTKTRFPFTFIHYSPRLLGFWAQGLAEQLVGTQIELNQILHTISKAIRLTGVPRVFLDESSKVVSSHLNNEVGAIVKFRGVKPSYEVAPSNAPELYAERDRLIQYGFQQCGVSMMQASSQKPQGLDSGEAIRTYDDISTDRFAVLSRRYDDMFVDLAYQIVDLAKDIAEREGKYSTVYPNKNGIQHIDLPEAGNLAEDSFVIQCLTQSSLPKEPAGRLAKVTEMMQAGLITPQEGRRMLDFPDIEQIETLANAPEERIFQILDEIVEEGKFTTPTPFMNLELASQFAVQYINQYEQTNLSDTRLQLLRDFFTQVQAIKQGATTPPPPTAPGIAPQAAPMPTPQSPLVPNAAPAAVA